MGATRGLLKINIQKRFCEGFSIANQTSEISFDVRSESNDEWGCSAGKKTVSLWVETRWEQIDKQGYVMVHGECDGCGRHRQFSKKVRVNLE